MQSVKAVGGSNDEVHAAGKIVSLKEVHNSFPCPNTVLQRLEVAPRELTVRVITTAASASKLLESRPVAERCSLKLRLDGLQFTIDGVFQE